MVRRQPAARNRWTDRYLRLANGVHAGEQGATCTTCLGKGRTTADLDGRGDMAKLVLVLRVHHRFPKWTGLRQRRCWLDKPIPDYDLCLVALGHGLSRSEQRR